MIVTPSIGIPYDISGGRTTLRMRTIPLAILSLDIRYRVAGYAVRAI